MRHSLLIGAGAGPTTCWQASSCSCTSSSCSSAGTLPPASASSHWRSSCCAHSRTAAFLSVSPLLSRDALSSALHPAHRNYWQGHCALCCATTGIQSPSLDTAPVVALLFAVASKDMTKASHFHSRVTVLTLLRMAGGPYLRYCMGTRSLIAAKAIFLTCMLARCCCKRPGRIHEAGISGYTRDRARHVNAIGASAVAGAEILGHTSSLMSLVLSSISGKLHGAADRECSTAFLTSCAALRCGVYCCVL